MGGKCVSPAGLSLVVLVKYYDRRDCGHCTIFLTALT